MIWGYGGLILVRISQYILVVYHVPRLILSALWVLVHLNLDKTPQSECCYHLILLMKKQKRREVKERVQSHRAGGRHSWVKHESPGLEPPSSSELGEPRSWPQEVWVPVAFGTSAELLMFTHAVWPQANLSTSLSFRFLFWIKIPALCLSGIIWIWEEVTEVAL